MKIVTWLAQDTKTLFGTPGVPIATNIVAIAHKEDASEYVGLSLEAITPSVCKEITTIPENTYYFYNNPAKGYWLTLDLALQVAKELRTKATEKLTVTVGAHVIDGNEGSQDRMTRAYIVLGDTGTRSWKLHNNLFVTLTGAQLKEAVSLAGQAQLALWQKYSIN